MTVFSHSSTTTTTTTTSTTNTKQVFPLDYESDISQRFLDSLSSGDISSASALVTDPFFHVNFVGAVSVKLRHTDVVLRDYLANEINVYYEVFKTDVTPLFLSACFGHLTLLRQLLNVGADVNQKLFRGYATTVAVREGHLDILEVLVKAGASQPACEQALLEASIHGRANFTELLMRSDLIRPRVASQAFVTACGRGFTDVETLMKCGVDANAVSRVLIQSSKPTLHTNISCNGLVAAVVTRQVAVVRLLLQADVRTDVEVKLGAWSWDTDTGEEFRVGAGLAEPYPITWCAVEYFEATGAILQMLLTKNSPNVPHQGRTLLHHAILCSNAAAVNVLLDNGAAIERPTSKILTRPLHMAARLGLPIILRALLNAGSEIDSRTNSGDTALMLCAKYRQEECLKVLAEAGADFGLVNNGEYTLQKIACANKWSSVFQQSVLELIKSGKIPQSSNTFTFSPLLFSAQAGDSNALKTVIALPGIDLNQADDSGFTAVLLTALQGHVESFRILVYAKADVKLRTKLGESVISLSERSHKRDLFENVLLEYALEMDSRNPEGFYALHCAACKGDLIAVRLLTSKGYDVNSSDGDSYTPIMLAAREGHAHICKFLISQGAWCDLKNPRGETALLLARSKSGKGNDAEYVILDELARRLVLGGTSVKKHTRGGKGSPHAKIIRIEDGVLKWGKSSKRNVVCKKAEVGPSASFRKNRRGKSDSDEAGVFHVVTTKNKEVHFVCEGGVDAAKLWTRGIRLLSTDVAQVFRLSII